MNFFQRKQIKKAMEERIAKQERSAAERVKRPRKTAVAKKSPAPTIPPRPSLSDELDKLYRSQMNQARSFNQLDRYGSLNNARQQQKDLLQALMNQKGAGMPLNLTSNLVYDPYGQSIPRRSSGAPKKPMTPKFKDDDLVTVRSGSTIWRIVNCEGRNRYGEVTYILQDQKRSDRQVQETENDLKLSESASSGLKAKIDFATVVMSDGKRDQILEALEQIHQYDLIFEKWGFGETIEKGRGVSMLFYGPPGTGKTLVCQAIANKLGKTLNIISTADIESSAPGEAERNIRKHFKEAKEKGSILLFDECDSLIYTRQNVGPILSAQINELLSQIERFEGLTLFTTNRLGTLDEAVNRRLALKLEFEMPNPAERAEIWKRMFPTQAPVAKDVDWDRLAIIEVTGGYIKNAVLRAARMAAIEKIEDHKKEIKMEHLVKALKLETSSMIDFESAREAQEKGVGYVSMGASGKREIVRKTEIVKKEGEGGTNV
jgi:SpoVK/Ycf46/Vps4 family AAA+-type ATPase